MIRIRKQIDSETLHLPELKPLIGKTVEIYFFYEKDSCVESQPYSAWFALAGQNVLDQNAFRQLRSASMA